MGNGDLLLVVVLVVGFFFASETGWLQPPNDELDPTSTPYPTFTAFPTFTPQPTINPTPTTNLNNLAVFPDDWDETFGVGSQIISRDYTVKHGDCAYSLRLEPHSWLDVNFAREINFDGAIAVEGGDRIVFSCWVKTGFSSQGHNFNDAYGGRIGLDFYVNGVRSNYGALVNGVEAWDRLEADGSFVSFGSDWALQTIDCVVPSGLGIDACIPWLQVCEPDDAGVGWFSDSAIYVY